MNLITLSIALTPFNMHICNLKKPLKLARSAKIFTYQNRPTGTNTPKAAYTIRSINHRLRAEVTPRTFLDPDLPKRILPGTKTDAISCDLLLGMQ